MKHFVIVLFIFVAGCGTGHYKKFDLSNVHKSQGVIIGKVDVKHNSQPFDTTACKFCAGSACQRLLEDGYVFMPVGKGPLTEGRLSCSYPDLCCEDLVFSVESFEVGTEIIYFGNLLFTVVDEPPLLPDLPSPITKPSPKDDAGYQVLDNSYQARKRRGEVTSHVDAFAKDLIDDFAYWLVFSDGTPKQRVPYKIYFGVSVKDGMADVVEVFQNQVKKEGVRIEKNLFIIELDKKEKSTQKVFYR